MARIHCMHGSNCLLRGLSDPPVLCDFILYGSKATGSDTGESDIDIMVEIEEEVRDVRWDIYNMTAEVNMDFGCVISPILFSRRELEDGPMEESPIYKRVIKDTHGKILCFF